MKKIVSGLLVLVLGLSLSFYGYAANVENRIYAKTITAKAGDTIEIPIKIENNGGFMGFSVSVSYDDKIFTPTAVSKGEMLSGLFNDNLTTTQNNSFKVVYSGTENTNTDGVIFNAVFDIAENASGKYSLKLSYSQPDTFNEAWANVTLNCEEITVNVISESKPDAEKPLSVKMREWLDTLPSFLKIILGVIVIPISYVIGIFE